MHNNFPVITKLKSTDASVAREQCRSLDCPRRIIRNDIRLDSLVQLAAYYCMLYSGTVIGMPDPTGGGGQEINSTVTVIPISCNIKYKTFKVLSRELLVKPPWAKVI